jgi:hypothetical protein
LSEIGWQNYISREFSASFSHETKFRSKRIVSVFGPVGGGGVGSYFNVFHYSLPVKGVYLAFDALRSGNCEGNCPTGFYVHSLVGVFRRFRGTYCLCVLELSVVAVNVKINHCPKVHST